MIEQEESEFPKGVITIHSKKKIIVNEISIRDPYFMADIMITTGMSYGDEIKVSINDWFM